MCICACVCVCVCARACVCVCMCIHPCIRSCMLSRVCVYGGGARFTLFFMLFTIHLVKSVHKCYIYIYVCVCLCSSGSPATNEKRIFQWKWITCSVLCCIVLRCIVSCCITTVQEKSHFFEPTGFHRQCLHDSFPLLESIVAAVVVE